MDRDLLDLAACAGLCADWTDYRGQARQVSGSTLRTVLEQLGLPCATPAECRESCAELEREKHIDHRPLLTAEVGEPVVLEGIAAAALPAVLELEHEDGTRVESAVVARSDDCVELAGILAPGYHRLRLPRRELTIAVAPRQAFGMRDAGAPARAWGLAAQLYSLRRPGDGGIGDFTALADFAAQAGRAGASALAISPVHALFSADVQRFSPYAPSSRLFLNALHVDPARALPEETRSALFSDARLAEQWARLEHLPLIDWPAAAALRLRLLRAAFDALPSQPAELQAFRRDGGGALQDHACFEALQAAQLAMSPSRWHWRDWPAALRDPRLPAVREFARANATEVDFHVFLQWLARRGLAEAQRAAREAGMAVGLIGDLAVGTDSGGSHAWSRQEDMLGSLSLGAPPDLINGLGQCWGLSSFSPRALRLHGYAPFIEMLRAVMRDTGGVRIDHVLGLERLWLVPAGASAADGAYLRYPRTDLLRLLALESWRQRAVVIGEDLGTVPEGFRDHLAAAGVMGMQVLWFEREHGYFIDPSRWSPRAMATTSTHDLPTVAGWWTGRDIEWRARCGQLPPGSDVEAERATRAVERTALWNACAHAGLVPHGAPPADSLPAVDAALGLLVRSPAPLALVPAEDLLGIDEQPNLPGTVDEHPNWRRRLPGSADALFRQAEVRARLTLLARERGSA